MYNEIFDLIKSYNNIVVVRHVGVDPDAMASSIALRDSIKLTFPEKNVFAIGNGTVRFNFMGFLDKGIDFNQIDNISQENRYIYIKTDKEMITLKKINKYFSELLTKSLSENIYYLKNYKAIKKEYIDRFSKDLNNAWICEISAANMEDNELSEIDKIELIKKYHDSGEIEVLGITATEPPDLQEIDGWPVIRANDISSTGCDHILICTTRYYCEILSNAVRDLGIDEQMILPVLILD